MVGTTRWLCFLVSCAIAGAVSADDTFVAPRTLQREPDYNGKPRYALVVYGETSDRRVWLVEDGKQLYVDRNENGDLTDDGPPLSITKERKFYSNVSQIPDFDADYAPFDLSSIDGESLAGLTLHRSRRYGRDQTSLSITVDGWRMMHSSPNSFWGNSPGTAPVVRLSEKLSPRLLRATKYEIGQKPEQLAIGFVSSKTTPDAPTIWMGIEGLPREFPVVVRIQWPTASETERIETSHRLTERCCGHLFYTSMFELPPNVVAGMARATVEMPFGFDVPLEPTSLISPWWQSRFRW